jgi:hypothetical protein
MKVGLSYPKNELMVRVGEHLFDFYQKFTHLYPNPDFADISFLKVFYEESPGAIAAGFEQRR